MRAFPLQVNLLILCHIAAYLKTIRQSGGFLSYSWSQLWILNSASKFAVWSGSLSLQRLSSYDFSARTSKSLSAILSVYIVSLFSGDISMLVISHLSLRTSNGQLLARYHFFSHVPRFTHVCCHIFFVTLSQSLLSGWSHWGWLMCCVFRYWYPSNLLLNLTWLYFLNDYIISFRCQRYDLKKTIALHLWECHCIPRISLSSSAHCITIFSLAIDMTSLLSVNCGDPSSQSNTYHPPVQVVYTHLHPFFSTLFLILSHSNINFSNSSYFVSPETYGGSIASFYIEVSKSLLFIPAAIFPFITVIVTLNAPQDSQLCFCCIATILHI